MSFAGLLYYRHYSTNMMIKLRFDLNKRERCGITGIQIPESRVGKCSYISCSYMFLYYIRIIFWEAKMFLYFLILFSLIILLRSCTF